jgi:hypothetical protein
VFPSRGHRTISAFYVFWDMDDDIFLLPVPYKGEELELESKLLTMGYVHRFEVNISGIPVLFEPDEEGSYRALVSPEQVEAKGSPLKYELLQAVAGRLAALHDR